MTAASNRSRTVAAKPRKRKVVKGVAFQSRGRFPCVRVDGAAKQGLHPALNRVLGEVKYVGAETPVAATPPASQYISSDVLGEVKSSKYPPQACMKAGSRVDSELTSSIKLAHALSMLPVGLYERVPRDKSLPSRAFWDPTYRKRYCEVRWGRAQHRDKTRLLNICNRMMKETRLLWYHFDRSRLRPVATQVPVALGRIGTPLDLVVQDYGTDPTQPSHVVCEVKVCHHTLACV